MVAPHCAFLETGSCFFSCTEPPYTERTPIMAAARYTCPSCKATLKVADALPPGKIIKCPACAVTFRVTVAQALAPSPGLSHGPAQPSGGMPRPAQGEASPEEEPDRDEELEDRPPRR